MLEEPYVEIAVKGGVSCFGFDCLPGGQEMRTQSMLPHWPRV